MWCSFTENLICTFSWIMKAVLGQLKIMTQLENYGVVKKTKTGNTSL